MANIFIGSDWHIGHANILTFQNADGSRMRPFDSVEQMDEFLLDTHNSIVRPQDKFYDLGDVAMKRKDIIRARKRNGHQRLCRGNHDIYGTKYYLDVFEEVYGTRTFDDMILSHIPLHPESLGRRVNVHGHVHSNPTPYLPTHRYFNVCVEVRNWKPVALEDLRVEIRKRVAENEAFCATMTAGQM